jgi:hypothetical protein
MGVRQELSKAMVEKKQSMQSLLNYFPILSVHNLT